MSTLYIECVFKGCLMYLGAEEHPHLWMQSLTKYKKPFILHILTQKNTHIRRCKIMHKCTSATVTVHIITVHVCTVTVALAFNILVIFSSLLVSGCSHSPFFSFDQIIKPLLPIKSSPDQIISRHCHRSPSPWSLDSRRSPWSLADRLIKSFLVVWSMGFLVEGLISLLLTPIAVAIFFLCLMVLGFWLVDFDGFDYWVWWLWLVGFDDFDQWVLVSGFGILMGGLIMEAGLMVVVVWVDDGGWVDDRCCPDHWWWLGIETRMNILLNKCVE